MGGRQRDEKGTAVDSAVADENERLVREYFEAVWNEGDLSVLDTDVVSDDYVLHAQSNDEYSVGQLRTAWADWYRGFPDLSNDIEDVIGTDDRVVIRYRFSGTHDGEVMGIPATGKAVETADIVIFRLRDGQIVEAWAMDDVLELGKQLDASA